MEVQEVPLVIATADTYEMVQGTEVLIDASTLADNDVDSSEGDLIVVSVGNPMGGIVTKVEGNITFVSTGYAGDPADFEYVVENGAGTSATGNVYVNVTALTPIEAYIYHNEGLLNKKSPRISPPALPTSSIPGGALTGTTSMRTRMLRKSARMRRPGSS